MEDNKEKRMSDKVTLSGKELTVLIIFTPVVFT